MATTADSPPEEVSSEQLDHLYHGPLEEFTQARNELAKSLRSDGKGAAADWVKGLTKPSRAAWLVNQLAVRKSKEIAELLDTGRELRAAQEEMLAGSPDRDKLRQAAHREQQVVGTLVRTAEAIGREHGVGAQVLTRVGETLQAASSDPKVAEAIHTGRLTREQRAIGLVGPAAPAKPRGKGARAKERETKERRNRQQQAKRRKEAERKLATAEKALERERAKLERARETVEEAERRVHSAELDTHAARRSLDDLQR